MAKNHPTRYNLTGETFGRWFVIEEGPRDERDPSARRWWCRCSCNKQTVRLVRQAALRNGHSGSCGCLAVEINAMRERRHGKHNSPEYVAWASMKMRCYNPNGSEYHNYGGRGITVCERWACSFEAFLEDMGPRPSSNHSIDRFPDKDGNYEPSNCRWATPVEQSRNRRGLRLLTCRGRSLCIAEWSEISGVHKDVIRQRIRWRWLAEEAIFTPSDRHRPRKGRIRNPACQ